MNTTVLGGLVEQWVWRCQMIATQYQLRQPINLQAEVTRLVEQAEAQARALAAAGPVFLAKIESRLDITAHIAALPEPLNPEKLTDPAQFSRPGKGLACARRCVRDAAERLRPEA